MDTILLTYPGENVTQKAISLAAGTYIIIM